MNRFPSPCGLLLLAGMLTVLAWARPDPARAQEGGCVVAFVMDGDTFNCRDGTTVRLLGIDAPEGGRFGGAARRALATLLPVDSRVRLETEDGATDSDGRMLAYVFANGRMTNEVLVRLGYAFYRPDPDRARYAVELRRAEQVARSGRLGVWSR